jgi:hypothetical protein
MAIFHCSIISSLPISHVWPRHTLSYHSPVYRSVRKQYVVSSSLPDITHSNHAAHLQTSINLLRIRKVDRVPESDVRPLYCLLAYSSTLNPTSRELDISYNAYTRLKQYEHPAVPIYLDIETCDKRQSWANIGRSDFGST